MAKEVILCGGAFNSPQLLQVSGIGDSEHLKKVGVEPVHHLPGVGANLQDHLEVYVQHSCTKPVSLNPMLKMHYRPFIGLQWLFRRGAGASNHFEGGGFIRGNDSFKYPNLMFHFLPIAVRYDGTAPAGGHGYQVHIGPMYSKQSLPHARFCLSLRSKNLMVARSHPGLSVKPIHKFSNGFVVTAKPPTTRRAHAKWVSMRWPWLTR
jgi:choline dehydrogenase